MPTKVEHLSLSKLVDHRIISPMPMIDPPFSPEIHNNIRPGFTEYLFQAGRKYLVETSFHGLKYLVEGGRHLMERMFWVVASVLSSLWALYLIYQLLIKWTNSPILVSLASTQSAIYHVPFPSLTLCNMNKVRNSRVQYIRQKLANLTNSSLIQQLETESLFIHEICSSHKNEQQSNFSDNHTLNLSGDELKLYLNKLGHSCSDLIKSCSFLGEDRNCSEFFMSTMTDAGQCCSFNIMPPEIMFRGPEEYGVNNQLRQQWSANLGFNISATQNDDPKAMPLRSLGAGKHVGLSVLLDVQKEEYFCSDTDSVGFTGRLHSPETVPEVNDYGFAIHAGTESFFEVNPTVINSLDDIRYISVDKRQCYFEGEKPLSYFYYYNYNSCFQECVANFTFKHCGCVAFYMPRHSHQMPLCATDRSQCMRDAILLLDRNSLEDGSQGCHCLLPCAHVDFSFDVSFGELRRVNRSSRRNGKESQLAKYSNDSYIADNLALVHVFFKQLHFMRYERHQMFGIIDFLSNVGGVLGLCMGVSIISMGEVVYFFTLRLFFNWTMNRREQYLRMDQLA